MKLLLVTREYPPFVKGGMCRVAEYLVRGAHRHGIDLTLIANHPGWGKFVERTNTITIYRVPSFGSTFLTQLPFFGYHASVLVQKLQQNFDVIYSNYTPLFGKFKRPLVAGFVATRYGEYVGCRETGKPVHALLNRLYIPLDRRLVKKADGIIVNSRDLVHEINWLGGETKRVSYVPIGIDTDIFRPVKPRVFTSEVKKILCVGRLDSRKGIDSLLKAFKALIRDVSARLIIVGDGPERQNLLKLADGLSIPVDFLGMVPYADLPQIY
ncbi:MAG: glycosyltransferase family 4 protein, partial [Desulfobacterales bacterium]|nr:glycosyltransferase family 4 protein [Desulfobacterales bacterium]